MKAWQLAGLMVVGFGTLMGGSALHPAPSSPGTPVWLSDVGAAQEASRQSGKPLFVAFR